jgi:hypothetical protein
MLSHSIEHRWLWMTDVMSIAPPSPASDDAGMEMTGG